MCLGHSKAGQIVVKEEQWAKQYCALVRADFRLFDEYKFQHEGVPKFKFPIYSFCMKKDTRVTPQLASLWKDWTAAEFTLDELDMGHLTALFAADKREIYFAKVVEAMKKFV